MAGVVELDGYTHTHTHTHTITHTHTHTHTCMYIPEIPTHTHTHTNTHTHTHTYTHVCIYLRYLRVFVGRMGRRVWWNSMTGRYLVYLLYEYKCTNTDTHAAADRVS